MRPLEGKFEDGVKDATEHTLLGMVQEDFTRAEMDRKDPVYPYNVLVRAHRTDDSA